MAIITSIILSILLHVFVGWEWTVLAGVLCGWLMTRQGWLGGAVSVAAGWGIFVLYDYISAPAQIGRMLEATGQIFGNLPGPVVVVLTIFIGGLLGLLGGLVGSRLRQFVESGKPVQV